MTDTKQLTDHAAAPKGYRITTPAEHAGTNRVYDAAYLYAIGAGFGAGQAHEHAQAAAEAYEMPSPDEPDPLHRIADALDRIAAALEAALVEGFDLPKVAMSAASMQLLQQAADDYGIDLGTPGPWALKFQRNAVAAWDELCADPPTGTQFYHGFDWDIFVTDRADEEFFFRAAIIPEHANDGREFVAVRPGVTLPDGLAHLLMEKPVQGGEDD